MKSIYEGSSEICVWFLKPRVLITKSWAGFHAIRKGKCVLFTAAFPENSACMVAKMEFHPGLDEVREHLHFLSSSFFFFFPFSEGYAI